MMNVFLNNPDEMDNTEDMNDMNDADNMGDTGDMNDVNAASDMDDGIALNNESNFVLPEEFLDELAQLADYVLMQEQAPLTAIMSVTLVDDAEIARLNEEYRAKQGPTDVLSFPCDDEEASKAASALGEELDDDDPSVIYWAEFEAAEDAVPILLGDVVIAPEFAAKQAVESLGLELPELASLDAEVLRELVGQASDEIAVSEDELREAVLAELRLLLVHGTLHLLGHNHTESDEQAQEMEQREKEILGDWAEFSLVDLGDDGHGACGDGCG